MHPFSDDIKFVQYLDNKEEYQDAIIALNQISLSFLNSDQIDTVNYLKGWSFYNTKMLDSSASYLLKVRNRSSFYLKSRFFSAYNYTFLHQYVNANNILQSIPDNISTREIKYFEKSGIALLKNDYKKFDSLQQKFSYRLYALSAQEKKFTGYRYQLCSMKRKSSIIAGLMSAVLPGSGKVYAGKPYQGIGSLLPIVALALLTNESYHKRGPRSAEFYFFGSMLTVFYVGNIWGSVFAVKINREENEKLIRQKILFDLQIPLRTIFN
ncbi:MAG TPA: hypothetical protein VFX43_14235 [Chitinophagaceae bacterium]|nr:hypothetical protein [Chitinophagaceae bacterium]